MNEEQYTARRAQLVKEYNHLVSSHCHLCAKARVRKIADLDYEVKGIDKEETKRSFRYYNLK
jgi:cell division protein FtsL